MKIKSLLKKKKLLVIELITIFVIAAIIIVISVAHNKASENSNPSSPATTGGNSDYQVSSNSQSGTPSQVNNAPSKPAYSPLTSEEKQKVSDTILSSEFVDKIPEKYPISLTFFKLENEQTVWQDKFLIGKGQFLTSGTPGIKLTLNSKYISQLNGSNLCDIIKQANNNGDLKMETEYSTASLFLKYAGLIKYRGCFGF